MWFTATAEIIYENKRARCLSCPACYAGGITTDRHDEALSPSALRVALRCVANDN